MVGLKRTKNDIVTEQVKEVLTSTNLLEVSCKNSGWGNYWVWLVSTQLFANSLESVDKLKSLNAFKEVNLELDACRDASGELDGAEVTFNVKENGLLASSISANAGTQSGDAVSTCM